MSFLSALAKAHSLFRPVKKAEADEGDKPTNLRVGLDGDDESRIVFIIEDTQSGEQFAHVSLTPDGALEIAEAIMDLADEANARREGEAQADELSATEAFQEHCDGLAQADKLKAQDDAYMQLAKDADVRLMTKLAMQAQMYGGGYDVPTTGIRGSIMVDTPNAACDAIAATHPAAQAIAEAEERRDMELIRKRAAFKETMARMVEAVQAEATAEETAERQGKAAEADKG